MATTYRHLHNQNANIPSITFYFNINYDTQKVDIGWALCSPKDNFNKRLGRSIAKQTVHERGITNAPLLHSVSLSTMAELYIREELLKPQNRDTHHNLLKVLSAIEQHR